MFRFLLPFLLIVSCSSFANQQYKYHAIAVGNVQEWNIVRYQTETGRAWYIGSDGFVEIRDERKVPISVYDFSVTNTVDVKASGSAPDFNWQLIRINTNTGETWWASDNRWIKVKESGGTFP